MYKVKKVRCVFVWRHVLKSSSCPSSPFLPSRGLHAAVCFSFTDCGSSTVFYGAGSWPKYSPGKHRRLETHLPKAGRDRLLQLHGKDLKFLYSFTICLLGFWTKL